MPENNFSLLGSSGAHLGVLQHSVSVLAGGSLARSLRVGLDPAHVFAPPKAPLLQAVAPRVEALCAATPAGSQATISWGSICCSGSAASTACHLRHLRQNSSKLRGRPSMNATSAHDSLLCWGCRWGLKPKACEYPLHPSWHPCNPAFGHANSDPNSLQRLLIAGVLRYVEVFRPGVTNPGGPLIS